MRTLHGFLGSDKVHDGLTKVRTFLLGFALSFWQFPPVEAASFDCAKASTDLEKRVCADGELSGLIKRNEAFIATLFKLDQEVSQAYAESLAKSPHPESAQQAQQSWLADRDRCFQVASQERCLEYQHRKRLIALKTAGNESASPRTPSAKPKGEYFLSRNEMSDPVCADFTRNLNQFRHLDFGECNLRLSPKYPQFSRPQWEEIPFDLAVAEKIIRGRFLSLSWTKQGMKAEYHGDNQQYADLAWQGWLKASEPMRLGKQLRLWRTQIDMDGDGKPETFIHMAPGIPDYDLTQPPYSCDYNNGVLHLLAESAANPDSTETVNRGSLNGSDVIYDYASDRYYRVEWNPNLPAYHNKIGATAGVKLWTMRWAEPGYPVSAGKICLIDWVPTGRYKPLKHSNKR